MGLETGEQNLGMAEFEAQTRMRPVTAGLDTARNAELMGLKKAMEWQGLTLMV